MDATVTQSRRSADGDTRHRVLDAAERLYVEQGLDGVSLRPVTTAAGANIAAVNYHFGGRDNLLRAMLARRLDPLNAERDRLLTACEARWHDGDGKLACEHVLAALLAPVLVQARQAGPAGYERLHFFGRVYADGSPLTIGLLKERYEATQRRFLAAFARALPELALPDLRLRLSFVLKAVSGVVAGSGLREMVTAFGRGSVGARPGPIDVEVLASLGNLMAGALTAPARTDARLHSFGEVLALADTLSPAPRDAAPVDRMDAAE